MAEKPAFVPSRLGRRDGKGALIEDAHGWAGNAVSPMVRVDGRLAGAAPWQGRPAASTARGSATGSRCGSSRGRESRPLPRTGRFGPDATHIP